MVEASERTFPITAEQVERAPAESRSAHRPTTSRKRPQSSMKAQATALLSRRLGACSDARSALGFGKVGP